MKKTMYQKTMAGILVLLLIAGILLSILAGILQSEPSVSGGTNIESLMETGLTRSQAAAVSDALEDAGCGKLTGVETDDVGDGYEMRLYDGREDVWYVARLDYYGNLLTLQEAGDQSQE